MTAAIDTLTTENLVLYGVEYDPAKPTPHKSTQHKNAFLRNPPGEDRFFHFKEYAKFYFPKLTEDNWNPWTDRVLHALCDNQYGTFDGPAESRFISFTGCASASKTWSIGVFASCWWHMDPKNSAVVLTSTTKDAMSRRAWPVIQDMDRNRYGWERDKETDKIVWKPDRFGNMIDSKHIWQAEKGDSKHSIICQALDKGELQHAIENLKGQHTPRRMIVIDEANQTHESIYANVSNARKGCQCLIVVFIGNAIAKLDWHGRVCEPADGWNSIRVEDEVWRTRGVPEYQIDPGWCFHFDGEKSPNVIGCPKHRAGKKTVYPYLYTWEDYKKAREMGRTKEIGYWANDRGFWCADDLKNTVVTETMIDMYDAYGKDRPFIFASRPKALAAFDPAFGGDAAVYVAGLLGRLEDGKLALKVTDWTEIHGVAASKLPMENQYFAQLKSLNESKGVAGDCFGLDEEGLGSGIAGLMQADWSMNIHRVAFGGKASDMVASKEDPRPGHEVYNNRVTELWFSIRYAITGGVLQGINRDCAIQLCGREYEYLNRGRYEVVTKAECKKRIGRSPDHADALAVLVDVARQHGLVGGAIPAQRGPDKSWSTFAEKAHEPMNEDGQYREADTYS